MKPQAGGQHGGRSPTAYNGLQRMNGQTSGGSGSTTSMGRISLQTMLSVGCGNRRSESQDSRIMSGNETNEIMNTGTQKSEEQERKEEEKSNENGSGQRKRSRLQEIQNLYVKEGLTRKESCAQRTKIDGLMQQLHSQVENVFAKGDRGKTFANKLTIQETMRLLGLDIFGLMATIVNLQDEKAALQYQVITLQGQIQTGGLINTGNTGSPAANTYLQVALNAQKNRNMNIVQGKSLPLPEIPNNLKHAPSERIIIFKAKEKGIQQTKAQQEVFREDINAAIGEELMEEIDVIRPTRHGGHTVIFQSEEARNKAMETLRTNEKERNIAEERSCLIAPKKKYAKVVCRDPPSNIDTETALAALYGRNNPHLCQVPLSNRTARIIITRFGWIFELTSLEAAAIQAQGGRIRLGNAREIRVEEYIPIQQCYNCCLFGHNAKDCTSKVSYCRLCGVKGHAGWDCLEKDNRENWKCINCISNNEIKGLQLPTDHAAAQLHKCPCAQHHKEIRRTQMITAGIYTIPQSTTNTNLQNTGLTNMTMPAQANGHQTMNNDNRNTAKSKKSRSRSMKRTNQTNPHQSERRTAITIERHRPATTSSNENGKVSDEIRQNREDGQIKRGMNMQSLLSEGWKMVEGRKGKSDTQEERGRQREQQRDGTNSQSNLPMMDVETTQKPINKAPHDDDG